MQSQQTSQGDNRQLFNFWNKRLQAYFSNKQKSNPIPQKLLQKLQIIEKSINNEDIIYDDYPNLDEEEINQMKNHPESIQIQLYIQIAQMFLPKSDIQGKLDLRGESGLLWNKKNIILNQNEKILEISRKKKEGQYRQINLQNYKAKWIGTKMGRTQFELNPITSNKEGKKSKHLIWSDDSSVDYARQWYDAIKVLCHTYEDDQQKDQKKNDLGKRSTIAVTNFSSEMGQPRIQNSQTFAGNYNLNNSPNSLNKEKNDQIPQRNSEPKKQDQRDQQYEKLNSIKKPLESTKMDIKKVDSNLNVKENQSDVQNSKQQTHNKQKTKTENPDNLSKHPSLFNEIFSNGHANQEQLLSDNNFQLQYFQNNLRILQHSENQLHLKSLLLLEQVELPVLVQAIVNCDEQIKWNQQIQESRNLTILAENSTFIIQEKRKKYGRLYLPRDFVYMRYAFKKDNAIYILEKSSTHDDAQASMQTTRGEIYWGVWGIFTQKDKILLVYSLYQTNGGYISAHQDSAITISYLLQLNNLEHYLKQISFQHSFKKPRYISILFEQQVCQQNENYEQAISQEEEKQHQLVLNQNKNQNTEYSQKSRNTSQSSDCSFDSQNPEQIQTQKTQQVSEFKEEYKQMDVLSSKLIDETDEEYLRRLFTLVDQAVPIWASAIHNYHLGPIDVQPKFNKGTNGQHYIFKDEWQVEEKGGMRFIHSKKIELQRDIFKYLLKKIGSNILAGKSVMSISLPVYIFEKRSNLERHAHQMTFAPVFLEPAAKLNDPVNQMKEVIKFGLSCSMLYMTMEKPFNPILGETFQARINGCPIYCEQLSHHPPVCSFLLVGRGYRVHGHLEIQAQISPNSVSGLTIGYLQVDFETTKNSIILNMAPGYMGGTVYGDRMFYVDGVQWYVDVKNQLIGETFVSPNQGYFSKKKTPLDYVDGKIMRVTPKEIEKFQKETYKKYQGTKGQKFEQMMEVTGRFTESLFFDGKEELNWQRMFPYTLEYEENPLASDAIYRQDLIAWKLEDQDWAQTEKEKLENIQRNDRKQREKIGSKKKH